MWQRLIQTREDYAGLVMRVVLGVVILPHGAQKAFGWFGGFGFEGTMEYFTGTLGIPWLLGALVVVAELAGGVALIAGLLTRVTAAAIGTIMIVAAGLVHWPNGFFMNWYGAQAGEGFEFHLLAAALAAALVLRGGGALSLDGALAAGRPVER